MIDIREYEHEASYHTKKRFIIFDGHALIYRAYHAFPELTSPEGLLVNAVYGFSRILLTIIRDFEPEYIAVAFDHKGKTKRAEQFEAYKAHRPQMPDDLKPQIEIIKQVVATLNIPTFEQEGYEADDLIGTIATGLATSAVAKTVFTTIVTGDKDLLQLVTDTAISVWIPGNKWSKDTEYHEADVVKKLGVTPAQVVDLKALMGDASDNIPGVKGIGKVTAQKLIAAFGTLDELYATVDKLAENPAPHSLLKGSVLTKLIAGKPLAFVSRELAQIQTSVPVDFDLEKCVLRDYNKDEAAQLFEKFEFRSLLQLLPKDSFELSVQEALF